MTVSAESDIVEFSFQNDSYKENSEEDRLFSLF